MFWMGKIKRKIPSCFFLSAGNRNSDILILVVFFWRFALYYARYAFRSRSISPILSLTNSIGTKYGAGRHAWDVPADWSPMGAKVLSLSF